MSNKSCFWGLFIFFIFCSCEKSISTSTLSSCDSLKQGLLIPNVQDTLRLLSCIKISGCDSVRLGFSKSPQDLLRLNCYTPTIIIGTQQWMQKNLEVTKYRNGDEIPFEPDGNRWSQLTTGAWCYYNNVQSNGITYGKLYNWYAVNDPRGLAPLGWHIPNNDEWKTLSTFLGGTSEAGGKMKTIGNISWKSPNTGATNECGFSALPGGCAAPYGGGALLIGEEAWWWSSSQSTTSSTIAFFNQLKYSDKTLYLNSQSDKKRGLSVRCVKD